MMHKSAFSWVKKTDLWQNQSCKYKSILAENIEKRESLTDRTPKDEMSFPHKRRFRPLDFIESERRKYPLHLLFHLVIAEVTEGPLVRMVKIRSLQRHISAALSVSPPVDELAPLDSHTHTLVSIPERDAFTDEAIDFLDAERK